MNILQIIANKGWGGGEKYVWELACKLTERGHNVYIVIPPCDILSKKFANYETYTQLFHGPFDFVAIHSLAKLIKKHQIKIVHTHLFKHTMAALLARYFYKLPIKVIMTRHLCKPAKKTLHYPWLYSKIDKLIFVSEYARKAFFSSHPNINNEKTIVIYNSTTYKDNVSHPNYRETLCINSDKFLIGFAGTICPEKGINFLIDLASKLKPMDPDIIFIIAGIIYVKKENENEKLIVSVSKDYVVFFTKRENKNILLKDIIKINNVSSIYGNFLIIYYKEKDKEEKYQFEVSRSNLNLVCIAIKEFNQDIIIN